jgi:predicted nucleic acid-binding protein
MSAHSARTDIVAMRVYVDANIFIYYVDGEPSLQAEARRQLSDHLTAGAQLVTSEITVGECLRGVPIDDEGTQTAFSSVLEGGAYLSLIPVTLPLIRRAATLGAELNLKLVDAIHVATAEISGCAEFLTNDRRIRTPSRVGIRPFTP